MITVELFEGEDIVAGGVRRVRWRVQHGAGLVDASQLPGARVEALASGAGIVWRRRIELELPVGARVERAEVAPSDERPRGVLEHLGADRRGPAQRVVKTRFFVTADGRLERQERR
jgi:hypothetical protein